MNTLYKMLFSCAGVIIIGSLVIFAIESTHENSEINSMLDAIWWSVSTVTTVGYGDIVPVSETGKIIAIVYMFFGIGVIAIFFSVLATNFYKKRFEKDNKEFTDAQKLILKRIDDLEKNLHEIRSSLTNK